jgi:DNA-binding NarL/FixJ family response regulator
MITVLIVDDDEDLRRVVRIMLEVEGDFEIVGESEDGLSAVWDAGQTRPDIVVLDYRMPGRGGDEAAGMIRRVAGNAKILGFSAHLEDSPAWADAFLHKDEITSLPDTLRKLASRGE